VQGPATTFKTKIFGLWQNPGKNKKGAETKAGFRNFCANQQVQ
jgi:hypothetical protein